MEWLAGIMGSVLLWHAMVTEAKTKRDYVLVALFGLIGAALIIAALIL